jgi:hypothetical protein
MLYKFLLALAGCILIHNLSLAQDDYEIQVYSSPTVAKDATMLELHSNYTFGGRQYTIDGVLPTHNIDHETVEITHGFNNIFEVGFYFFSAIGDNDRTNYVGTHIRPRIMAPASWHIPFGLSLSVEGGYQKPQYAADDWTVEIRPIIDKTWGRYYLSINPTLDKALHGPDATKGFDFSPNIKVSYSITKIVATGFEYYGSMGTPVRFAASAQQQHQLFAAIDLDWSPDWEFNAGYGLAFTPATDGDIFKVILGYRFMKKKKSMVATHS